MRGELTSLSVLKVQIKLGWEYLLRSFINQYFYISILSMKCLEYVFVILPFYMIKAY